jgi:hypothetical protein
MQESEQERTSTNQTSISSGNEGPTLSGQPTRASVSKLQADELGRMETDGKWNVDKEPNRMLQAFEHGNVYDGYMDWYAWLASRTAPRAGQLVWGKAAGGHLQTPSKYRSIPVPLSILNRLDQQDRCSIQHFHETWAKAGVPANDFVGCYEAWDRCYPLEPCAVAYFKDRSRVLPQASTTWSQPNDTLMEGTLCFMHRHIQSSSAMWGPQAAPDGLKRGRLRLGSTTCLPPVLGFAATQPMQANKPASSRSNLPMVSPRGSINPQEGGVGSNSLAPAH